MTDISSVTTQRSARVAVRPFRAFSSLVGIDVSALSHPGKVRPNNEDQFFVTKLARSLETMLTSLPPVTCRIGQRRSIMRWWSPTVWGATLPERLLAGWPLARSSACPSKYPTGIFKIDNESARELERRARHIVEQVGSVIIDRGRQDATLRGMGSTLTAARSFGRHLLIVHVGDSRAYLFRAGRLQRLTRDHTYAQMLVNAGELLPCDVASSGVRHILTNALGGSDNHVEVDVDLLRVEDGDRLLLCSDGLTDLVDDDTIATTLTAARTSNDACAALVQLALDRGGRDNITAIVAGYTFPA